MFGAIALVGVLGVVRHSSRLVAVGAGGLFEPDFRRTVPWMYVSPVVGLLVVAALLDHESTNRNRSLRETRSSVLRSSGLRSHPSVQRPPALSTGFSID